MSTLVKFARPPVVEVACGLTFTLRQPLKTAHIGAFWDTIRSRFPVLDDAAPLGAMIEPASMYQTQQQALELIELPPLRRVWFISLDGRTLVQLQGDRFLFNWKRKEDVDPYPGFDVIFAEFENQTQAFLSFLQALDLGEPSFTQFELAYVNQIGIHNGLDRKPITEVLVDHSISDQADRFLPDPEAFNWTTIYQLPEQLGRLHMVAQRGRQLTTGDSLLRLDILARGFSPKPGLKARREWFELAHEWIIRGFSDVTDKEVQRASWGRQD